MKIQSLILATCLISLLDAEVVIVNGGEVTVKGAITETQIDIRIDYTANVKWLGVIFSKDEVNTDIHILEIDESNSANPVKVLDCYLDENGYIMNDDVKNIQPSITTFTSSIIPSGMKVAYNRDLDTGDLQDKRFYINDIIQICFISSMFAFRGQGFEKGNEKVCSFMSLHQKIEYDHHRILGNFAATALFGGNNLTVYATQSTDEGTPESWLFLSFIHKKQGLSAYDGKWIGVTYEDSLINTDLTLVQYAHRSATTEIHIVDMYITDVTTVKKDLDYIENQGGDDKIENLGALDQTQFMIAQFKHKFSTGDVNRDKIIESGENTFCFILGDNLEYISFVVNERQCLSFSLTTPYSSLFRVKQQIQEATITYQEPQNTVQVIKVNEQTNTKTTTGQLWMMNGGIIIGIILLMMALQV